MDAEISIKRKPEPELAPEPVPLDVKSNGIRKWQQAVDLIKEQDTTEYEVWWIYYGSQSCSFCKYFMSKEQSVDVPMCHRCPLAGNPCGCSENWEEMSYREGSSDFIDAFETYAPEMLKQIKAVPIT